MEKTQNKTDCKVSIIVPVYDVEKYLSQCIESLIKQTYSNIEIILVDDGSNDGSGLICDEFAKIDKRIIVIHKKNGGLSSARNAGINICTGNYLAFVDSDDYVENSYVEIMLKSSIVHQSDVVICAINAVDEVGNYIKSYSTTDKFVNNENKYDLLFMPNNLTTVVAWNKLYRREIFDTLRYMEGKIHEDEYAIYDVIDNTKNGISIVHEPLYNYRLRENSITTAKNVSEKIFDGISCFEYRLSRLPINSKYCNEAVAQLLHSCLLTYKKAKTNILIRNKIFELYKTYYDKYKKQRKCFAIKRKLKYFMFRYFKIMV